MSIRMKELDELNEQAWQLNRKDPKRAISMGLEAKQKSELSGYKNGIAQALKTLGACYIWLSRNEESLSASLASMAILKELGDRENEAQVNYNIGTNFLYLADYENALRYYQLCNEINKEIRKPIGLADSLNGMGCVYYLTGENEKALEVLEESRKICYVMKEKEVLIKVLDGLGETYYNLCDYPHALENYFLCLDLMREIAYSTQTESIALTGIGNTYAAMGVTEKALEYYNRSLGISESLSFKAGVVNTNHSIGKLHRKTGDILLALDYQQRSLSLATKINSQEGIYRSSEELAAMLEEQGDVAAALRHFKIYQQAKEEVKNEKATQRSRSVELQHKMEQSESEKGLLAAKNKELESYFHDLTLLSEIGQTIISSLSVEVILDTVHSSLNTLMDASGFGIGLYQEKENQIVFPVYIEGETKLRDISYDASDTNRLGPWCFQNSKEVFINDLQNEITNYIKIILKPLVGRAVESLIYLPLMVKGRTLGVITVQSFHKQAYTNYHLDILRNLAVYAAIALENARLYENMEETVEERTREVVSKKEEIERSYENTRLLSEIGQELTSTLSFETLFAKLHSNVNLLMDAAIFGIRIYHEEEQQVEYKFEMERGIRYPSESVSMADKDNYSVWCILNRKEIFINDNETEYKRYTNQIKVVSGEMPHSLIVYPLMIANRVLGVITVQSFQKDAYLPYHLIILKTLASYTAIALENASLYENLEEKILVRTAEVMKQKEIIEEKNKNITDSIRYAKKIQQALLPNSAEILRELPKSFIYYRPKDIVSGDFYWYTHWGDHVVFASADCTGHGVPGAFMSAICNDLMNQVIRDEHIISPAEALRLLDIKLGMLLKKSTDTEANDGMDIALCSLNMKTNELMFAGAHRPLLLIREGNVIEFKPDKLSIGGYDMGEKTFTDHVIKLFPDDRLYLFTDGFADQFGGPRGKKFKFRQLKELLLSMTNLTMKEQNNSVDAAFKEWKMAHEQVDDILLMGIMI
jgi:serine phosphatase RsbU (regulator of sigma subunit)/tetratricopeptide (TPR) repeat protein